MLEYIIKLSIECLVSSFVVLTSLFLKFYFNNVVLLYYSLKALQFCAGGNHFEFEGQRKVIFNEKHETYISKYKIMFQRMWKDDYLLHCNMQYIIVTGIEFPCVHW